MKAELKRLLANFGELAALAGRFESLADLETAEAEARSRVAAAQREAEGARISTAAELEANTAARNEVHELESRRSAAASELADIEAKIAKARAMVAGLAG
jgi:predicted  nucleic acid-binding Zn-ribbon protein